MRQNLSGAIFFATNVSAAVRIGAVLVAAWSEPSLLPVPVPRFQSLTALSRQLGQMRRHEAKWWSAGHVHADLGHLLMRRKLGPRALEKHSKASCLYERRTHLTIPRSPRFGL
jgi:hypothetical protein